MDEKYIDEWEKAMIELFGQEKYKQIIQGRYKYEWRKKLAISLATLTAIVTLCVCVLHLR